MKQQKEFVYDPRKQFSKWLAKSSSWFWFIYLTILAGLMAYRPEVSNAVIYIIITVSVVMLFHVWAYTKNSIYQKGLEAMLDKTKMELNLKNHPIDAADEEAADEGNG